MRLLVTSATGANGNGYGVLLTFDGGGRPLGKFSDDARIADPRGLAVEGDTRLLFLVGDEVSLYTRLIGTCRSSMRIAVEAWRRHRESTELVKVTEAIFTCVAVDRERKPRTLPPADAVP
jgi:hypothetical protein